MIFIFICILPELSQLLVASFSCEPRLYFFTGRYSEPCHFRHHVALGTLSLYLSSKQSEILELISMIVCSQVDMQFVLYIVGLGFTLLIDELCCEMCLVFWFKSSFIQIESHHELLYILVHMIYTYTFRVWIALGKWLSSILGSSVDVISFLQCRVCLRIHRI